VESIPPDCPAIAGQKILIAADDTGAASELKAALTGIGCDVVGITASGHDVIDLIVETQPALLLMSPLLRGNLNGVTLAAQVRQRTSIPVVFLIADADPSTLRGLGMSGPFGYVVKPYPLRELQMNIEMALYRTMMTAQAHELEDRFFAVSIDLLCYLGFGGYFKRLNPAWERTLGFSRQELMSKPFIEFVHPDDRARTLAQNKAVRSGSQARAFENRYLCKDGSYRWLLWNAAPDADRHVIYSVARDVTDRKQAEEEREAMLRELRTALEEVRTLQAILPICSYCKKIRDDENYWQTVEGYISRHTNTRFTHSICPACYSNEVKPQLDEDQ
jgi:PAS domain S-box-containing protein